MTTCAICGGGRVSGVFMDAVGRPVHYLCLAPLIAARKAAEAIKATGTPPRPRRQSIRRVRR